MWTDRYRQLQDVYSSYRHSKYESIACGTAANSVLLTRKRLTEHYRVRSCWHCSKIDISVGLVIVVVYNKDDTAGICIDYRRLNDLTKKDAYLLPRPDGIFDAIRCAKLLSTLNLASCYHQVPFETKD